MLAYFKPQGSPAETDSSKRKPEGAPTEPKDMKVQKRNPVWELHGGSAFVRLASEGDAPSTKIAGFDLDSTLVETKSGSKFATTADDWQWFSRTVPEKVREMHAEGFRVVIFSNQNGIKSATSGVMATKVKARLDQVIDALGCPVTAFASCQKDNFRKPNLGMWQLMDNLSTVEADKSISLYCGDAAGRKNDFADTDLLFAKAVGVEFRLPEDLFGASDVNLKSAVDTSGPNGKLVEVFSELGQLESKVPGGKFKAGAYKKAAKSLAKHQTEIVSGKQAQKLEGVGKAVGEKIDEFLTTGKVAKLEELRGN